MIRRHNDCFGFRLWKWGKFQIEIWFVPKGEKIEAHVHEHIDSNIVVLKGDLLGRIGERADLARRWKKYPVPANMVHEARALTSCIFINLERWDMTPTSAAKDFTAV